jgi:hypothetical protein
MKWRDGLTFTKDPDSNEPRGLDWTLYLEAIDDDETIVSSSWSVDPTGELTLNSASIVTGGKKTQVRYADGDAGETYTVTNRITTSSGVIDDRSFLVRVRER